jgi:hypothetical protein
MKLLIVSDIHGNWAALQAVLGAEADFDKDGKVELCRVAYPIETTVEAYARTPLASSDVESLIAVLRTGGTLPSASGGCGGMTRKGG